MTNNKAIEDKPYLQDLFDHMKEEHGLTLLLSEMQDIRSICNKYLSTENAQLREALRETSTELNKVFMDWYPYDDEVEIHRIGGIVDKAKQLLTDKPEDDEKDNI